MIGGFVKKYRLFLIISAAFLLSGNLSMADEMNEPFTFSDPAFSYQDKDVSRDELMEFIILMYGSPIATFPTKDYAEEIVSSYLLHKTYSEKAIEEKLIEGNERYQRQIKMIKMGLQSELYLQYLRNSIKVSDEEIRSVYEKRILQIEVADEYLLSHILVESLTEAKRIEKEIQLGNIMFAQAAQEFSIDPTSAVSGGDMNEWHVKSSLEDLFFEGITDQLAIGKLILAESSFGYHLVKLIDTRKTPIPNYEGLEEVIRNELLEQKLAEKTTSLREEIQFDLNNP